MQQLKILNSRDVKKIREKVEQQFGYFPQEHYAFLQNEKQRLFIVSRDIAKIDLNKLRIERIGLYFGEIYATEIRLSKEGAQLLGREAYYKKKKLKNVLDLSEEEVRKYFQGKDLEKDLGETARLVLLRFGNDVFGCAKYKEKKILNFMPKNHRGEVII